MYISINKWQFIGEFLKGPTSEFSYEGLCILYEYLNNSEEVLLNVKQVCNDYAEDNETEFMLQDFENFPSVFYTESSLDARVFEWLALDETDREVVDAFLECFGDGPDVFGSALAAYYGQYENDLEFAYDYVVYTAILVGVDENIKRYFDYDAFTRDLMFEYTKHNDYYFSNTW